MKIQLKRSLVTEGDGSAKQPSAAQLEYGELAVNYSTGDPALFIKDENDNIIRIAGVGGVGDDGQVEVPAETNPPATPLPGNLWFNPEDGRLYVYYKDANSEQWVDASPDSWTTGGDITGDSLTLTGDLDVGGDLTLGTDKILLDVETGNGIFTGSVLTGDTDLASTSSSGSNIYSGGKLLLQCLGSTDANEDFIDLWYGNQNKITLGVDGSGTFAGKITCDNRVQVNAGGSLDVFAEDDAYDALRIYNVAGTEAATIKSGGSATFAEGHIVFTNTGTGYGEGEFNGVVKALNFTGNSTVGAGGVFEGQLNGSQTSLIKADGSATFADSVVIGTAPTFDHSIAGTTLVQGGLYLSRDADNDPGIQLFRTGESGAKFSVLSNGSATFAGTVTASNITAFKSTLKNAVLSSVTLDDLKTAILNALTQLGGDE